MNWKNSLFKPKWQHKNADTRLLAVATEQQPQLFDCLLDIAGKDEDPGVRCAAIKRLQKLENILRLHSNETHTEVRALLETRIYQLATSNADSRPALELRVQVANNTTDRNLIEQLASHAPEAKLRRAALARVERQGLLGDCAIADGDAQNRRFAASRISQQTTLKRVIEALRKRDKALYTQLQARLHQELLQASDPGAVQAEALKICTLLEHQVVETERQDDAEIAVQHAAWKQIAAQVTDDMTARYQRACERLSAPDPVKSTPAELPEIADKPVTGPDPEVPLAEPSPAPQASEELAEISTTIQLYRAEHAQQPKAFQVRKLARQFETTWRSIDNPHPDDRVCRDEVKAIFQTLEKNLEQQRQQLERVLEQAGQLLVQLEQELAEGELHKALESRVKLQQAGKKLQASKHHKGAWSKINKQLAVQQARLRELRDWQHWSNNKIRKRLIAEMEILPKADLHPDALLDRMKALQTEWKTLEASEQIPGDKHFASAPWMWRKFNEAGHVAFETTRPFLDKRTDIQSRKAETLATFCSQLEQLALTENVDWPALGKALNQGRKKLHELKNIPAKQRQKLAKKLKGALDKANVTLQSHYEAVEKEKMKLIRLASQLAHLTERSEAISQAKALQSQWQKAGSLWRSREQELWNQFREHLDPLFEQLKQQQDGIRAAIEENRTVQTNLCDELQAMLDADDDLPAQRGKVQGLQAGWKDIEHPERKLQASFELMVKDYLRRVEEIEQQAQRAAHDRWWLKSELLHELATATNKAGGESKLLSRVQKKWPTDSSDIPLEQSLDQDFQDFSAGKSRKDTEILEKDAETSARALCIRLEFIAGLPSPDEECAQRMQYQVDRLAESLSGDLIRRPVAEEASAEEQAWLGMYALPEPLFSAFGARVKRAILTIMESN